MKKVKVNRLFLVNTVLLTTSFLWAPSSLGQVQIVEAGGGIVPNQQQANQTNLNEPSNNSSNDNEIVMNLYFQLEALQKEVQTLRGITEEQGYQIRRMQTESRDRYLDVDNRLRQVGNNSGADFNTTPVLNNTPQSNNQFNGNSSSNDVISAIEPLPNLSINQTINSSEQNVNNVTALNNTNAPQSTQTQAIQNTLSNTTTEAIPQNERDLYRTAFNLLIEESRYEESIQMFQQYINIYPEGRYLPNAYYWQGEGLILVERFNQAKDAFTTIVNTFPLDDKAAGAMLKLIVIYLNMGDDAQALQTLTALKGQYPNSITEIDRAEDYIRDAGL